MKTLFSTLTVSFAFAATVLAAPQTPVNDVCPVCGKNARLIFHSNTSKGRVIFFSGDCKDKFDKSPTKYSVKTKSP